MPRLDVKSDSLVSLSGVPLQINWVEFKKVINQKNGGLIFIETFEGWDVKQIKNVVLQFRDDSSMMTFVNNLEAGNVFTTRVSYEMINNNTRTRFFESLRDKTGVDLLQCNAIPPTAGNRWGSGGRRRIDNEMPLKRPVASTQKSQNRPVSSNLPSSQPASKEWSSNVQPGANTAISPRSNRSSQEVTSSSVSSRQSFSNFVLISELNDSCLLEDLKALAEECGKVSSIKMDVRVKLQYSDEATADKAVSMLNNQKINECFLQAEKCASDSLSASEVDLINFDASGGKESKDRGRKPLRSDCSSVSVEMRGVSPFNVPASSQLFSVLLVNVSESCNLLSDFELLKLAEGIANLSGFHLINRRAIIEYVSEKDAKRAISILDNRSLSGCNLRVEEYLRNSG